MIDREAERDWLRSHLESDDQEVSRLRATLSRQDDTRHARL